MNYRGIRPVLQIIFRVTHICKNKNLLIITKIRKLVNTLISNNIIYYVYMKHVKPLLSWNALKLNWPKYYGMFTYIIFRPVLNKKIEMKIVFNK